MCMYGGITLIFVLLIVLLHNIIIILSKSVLTFISFHYALCVLHTFTKSAVLKVTLIMSKKRISRWVQLNGDDNRGVSLSSISITVRPIPTDSVTARQNWAPFSFQATWLRHLYVSIWGCWVTLPNLKSSARFVKLLCLCQRASTKQRDSSVRWKMGSSCAVIPPASAGSLERKHSTPTLYQRRWTHLSMMTFWVILTFRLSQVYQHHSAVDIYLLLLVSDCLQTVCS